MTEARPVIRRLRRLAPLALVVVVAAACGDDNKSTAAPKTPPSATTASTATIPAPTGTGTKAGRKAKLLMGTRNLFPLLQTKISRFAPTQVEGKSLRVVALAGPQSFWAGRSDKERLLVTMRLKGGTAPKITLGQKVDFIGLLTGLAADASSLGVTSRADTTLLEKQGAYVNASAADVKLR